VVLAIHARWSLNIRSFSNTGLPILSSFMMTPLAAVYKEHAAESEARLDNSHAVPVPPPPASAVGGMPYNIAASLVGHAPPPPPPALKIPAHLVDSESVHGAAAVAAAAAAMAASVRHAAIGSAAGLGGNPAPQSPTTRCSVCGNRNASFGPKGGALPQRCGDCRFTTDVSMKHKLCEACSERRARFAPANVRTAARCAVCRLPGDVSVTHKMCETCGQRRAVVLPGGGRNAPQGIRAAPVRCRQCRQPGDAPVGEMLCESCLERRPAYAKLGDRAKRCRQCRMDGDVDVTHRVCEVCLRVRAGFAPPGHQGGALRCGVCKLNTDVSIKVARKCQPRGGGNSSSRSLGLSGNSSGSGRGTLSGATGLADPTLSLRSGGMPPPPPPPPPLVGHLPVVSASHNYNVANVVAATVSNGLSPGQAPSLRAGAAVQPYAVGQAPSYHHLASVTGPMLNSMRSPEGSVHGGHSFQGLTGGQPALNALMQAAIEQQSQAQQRANLAAAAAAGIHGLDPGGSMHNYQGFAPAVSFPMGSMGMATMQNRGMPNGIPQMPAMGNLFHAQQQFAAAQGMTPYGNPRLPDGRGS